jgi:hypothetical protein
VPVAACRLGDESVQVTYHGGHVVFGRNCAQIVYKYDLHHGDIVEFNLQAVVINTIIYMADSSKARVYTCHDHG